MRKEGGEVSFGERKKSKRRGRRTSHSVGQNTENLVSKDDLEVVLGPPVLLGVEFRRILGLDSSKRDLGSRKGVGLGGALDVLLLDVLGGLNLGGSGWKTEREITISL